MPSFDFHRRNQRINRNGIITKTKIRPSSRVYNYTCMYMLICIHAYSLDGIVYLGRQNTWVAWLSIDYTTPITACRDSANYDINHWCLIFMTCLKHQYSENDSEIVAKAHYTMRGEPATGRRRIALQPTSGRRILGERRVIYLAVVGWTVRTRIIQSVVGEVS